MKLFNQLTQSILISTSLMSITETSFAAAKKAEPEPVICKAVDAASLLEQAALLGVGLNPMQRKALTFARNNPVAVVYNSGALGSTVFRSGLSLLATDPTTINAQRSPLEVAFKFPYLVNSNRITPIIMVGETTSDTIPLGTITRELANLSTATTTRLGNIFSSLKILSSEGASSNAEFNAAIQSNAVQNVLAGYNMYAGVNAMLWGGSEESFGDAARFMTTANEQTTWARFGEFALDVELDQMISIQPGRQAKSVFNDLMLHEGINTLFKSGSLRLGTDAALDADNVLGGLRSKPILTPRIGVTPTGCVLPERFLLPRYVYPGH